MKDDDDASIWLWHIVYGEDRRLDFDSIQPNESSKSNKRVRRSLDAYFCESCPGI